MWIPNYFQNDNFFTKCGSSLYSFVRKNLCKIATKKRQPRPTIDCSPAMIDLTLSLQDLLKKFEQVKYLINCNENQAIYYIFFSDNT